MLRGILRETILFATLLEAIGASCSMSITDYISVDGTDQKGVAWKSAN